MNKESFEKWLMLVVCKGMCKIYLGYLAKKEESVNQKEKTNNYNKNKENSDGWCDKDKGPPSGKLDKSEQTK